MFLRFLFLIIFFMLASFSLSWGSEGEQKIVYLISGPRALSTVFLRMIESRGDFIVYNEPTIPVYDRVYYSDITEGWFRDDANTTFEEVKRKIFELNKNSDVFVKDMSFSSHEYILNDQDFMKNPSIHYLFLVRNPHHTSISFYKKVRDIFPGMSDLIGLKKLYEEYEAIRKMNPNGVKIIFSEQLYNTPRLTMSALCNHLSIPFSERAFAWKKYDQKFQGHNEWNEQKTGSHIHHWHGRAIQSEQMEKPSSYETDNMGNPSFKEIEDDAHRVEMMSVYRENLIYYKKFINANKDHLIPVNGSVKEAI